MKFSYQVLQELVKDKLPEPEKLADLLSLHSYECEGVLGKGDDVVLDLDILPNRASDSAGHIGMARDISAVLKTKLQKPDMAKLSMGDDNKEFSVEIKDEDLCRRYCAVKIKHIQVEQSPKWLKDRLESMGLNSINNVVDIGNYAMLITGQPMHIFDADKMGGRIIVRNAKDGEMIEGLDDKEYSLNKNDLVIADDNDVLGIAGIKGGKKAEIDENTTNIIIEAANFNPTTIRATARRLRLFTDASWRFERGVPSSFCEDGLGVIVKMIKDIAGGEVVGDAVDINYMKEHSPKIKVDKNYLDKVLGVEVDKKEITDILKSLEFSVENDGDNLVVVPPDFRLDVNIPNDVIEEVARVKGYEVIDAQVPSADVVPLDSKSYRNMKREIVRNMAGYGFYEIHTISFVGEDIIDKWGMPENMLLRLENPMQESVPFLRPSLLPNCVKAVNKNLKYEEAVKVFEIGHIFGRYGKDVNEEEGMVLIVAGKYDVLIEVKSAAVKMFDDLGIDNYSFEEMQKCDLKFMDSDKVASITIGGEFVGIIGMLDMSVLNMSDSGDIAVCEMKIEKVIQASKQKAYEKTSKYPASNRDISMFITDDTKVKDVEKLFYDVCKDGDLAGVELFDYAKVEGKLSVAFHLTFQSKDKTLVSEYVDEQMQKIMSEIEKNDGWDVR